MKNLYPCKITMARDDSTRDYHTLYKVIIPKELVNDYNVRLTRGSHSLVFRSRIRGSIEPCCKSRSSNCTFSYTIQGTNHLQGICGLA